MSVLGSFFNANFRCVGTDVISLLSQTMPNFLPDQAFVVAGCFLYFVDSVNRIYSLKIPCRNAFSRFMVFHIGMHYICVYLLVL